MVFLQYGSSFFHTFQKHFLWRCSNKGFVTTFALKWFFSSMVPVKYLQSNWPFFHTFQKQLLWSRSNRSRCYNFCTYGFPQVRDLMSNICFQIGHSFTLSKSTFCEGAATKVLLQLLHSNGFSPVWFLQNICSQIGHSFTLSKINFCEVAATEVFVTTFALLWFSPSKGPDVRSNRSLCFNFCTQIDFPKYGSCQIFAIK